MSKARVKRRIEEVKTALARFPNLKLLGCNKNGMIFFIEKRNTRHFARTSAPRELIVDAPEGIERHLDSILEIEDNKQAPANYKAKQKESEE